MLGPAGDLLLLQPAVQDGPRDREVLVPHPAARAQRGAVAAALSPRGREPPALLHGAPGRAAAPDPLH
eukprot:scaffold685_cov324-Prasinococcus_capsulatus_cf.AAC.11